MLRLVKIQQHRLSLKKRPELHHRRLRLLNMKESGLNLSCLCIFPSTPYVHGHATAVLGGEGGWQHYSDLHCLRKPQAGGHLAERGGSADQQQEIHGNWIQFSFLISVFDLFSTKNISISWKQDRFAWEENDIHVKNLCFYIIHYCS